MQTKLGKSLRLYWKSDGRLLPQRAPLYVVWLVRLALLCSPRFGMAVQGGTRFHGNGSGCANEKLKQFLMDDARLDVDMAASN